MKRRLRGFTLLELLVVTAVVSLLVSLVIPAVQQARESARRTLCQNRLKQIGLGVQSYLAVHGVYPTVLCNPDPFASVSTWCSMILPYVDSQGTYDSLNFEATRYAVCSNPRGIGVNKTAISSPMGLFMCPSDSTNKPQDYAMGLPPAMTQTPTNYAGAMYPTNFYAQPQRNWGMFPYWSDWDTWLKKGILQRHQPWADVRSARSITDGTSHTIYALEVRAKIPTVPGQADEYVGDIVYGTCYPLWFANIPIYHIVYQDCEYYNPTSPWFMGPYTVPRYGLNLPIPGAGAEDIWPPYRSAGSYHMGGAFSLFADGSVHFLSDVIDQKHLQQRISISQSELY